MMYTTTCITCKVKFSMPLRVERQRMKDGKSFYCPNGHPMVFTDSENNRLKSCIQQLETQVRELKNDLERWKGAANHSWKCSSEQYEELKLARRQRGYYHGRYKMLKAQLAGEEDNDDH